MRQYIYILLMGIIIISFGRYIDANTTLNGSKKSMELMSSETFMGLSFRSIGPAFTSGRIADFAINPKDYSEYYVAVAAGNVWKTKNSGITWEPIFDRYGAWSIADVEIDPNNPHIIWVGTGEYNSQRAIGYGDGVYRSEDGGKNWKNMGLKQSEHIGRIVIDPRNSHIYVAAQGPLWGPGGDRGLYKSIDNGKTWKALLKISENTGITDIVIDQRNPDVLYAAAYQRRRRVYTLINGGSEGGIFKSIDAGTSWTQLKSGLPTGDIGRIGLGISPVNPDVIYAIIEAEGKNGGFFRSENRGASWEKRSSYMSKSPQYYNRIIADPKNVDKVYSLDTYTKVTMDGGKTWHNLGNKNRHVDDHALWINPNDTRHLLIGGDGGIYESFDSGINWLFKSNLPITQFYRVSLDNAKPFYNVYGGTQDNNSMGGPSRTTSSDGIVSADWFVTRGGDGFETQVDPENSNIIYAQMQYGGLVRYDRKSGESIDIKPREGRGEAYRWNWNSPLIISPHLHTRLYFAANFLFRSDDRGNSWTKVSGDLTRRIDRNLLPVMGKIQSPDAVSKNASTSFFGSIVSISESPLKEGLIYVGTDDGLIQVTSDGGLNWQKYEKFPIIPEMTYVCFLYASLHEENTLFAAFDGRKNNDLKPYLLRSTDRGKNWISITSNLPKRGTVYTIAQDHINPNLLFVGTEFGVYFTIDNGKKWIQLKGGLPTTQVRDIEIQKDENDLVIATFGRGFYILDDYSPLRELTPNLLKKETHIFGIKDALIYIPSQPRYGQGETYFKARNPEFGAAITYYLKEPINTLKKKRKSNEKNAIENGKDIEYPSMEDLKAEDREDKPYLIFSILDHNGTVIRHLTAPVKTGIQRIYWDLRFPPFSPIIVSEKNNKEKKKSKKGMLVVPGKYQVVLSKFVNGEIKKLTESDFFNVIPLNNLTLPAENSRELVEFQKKVADLARGVLGTIKSIQEMEIRIKSIKTALHHTPTLTLVFLKRVVILENRLKDIKGVLLGDESIEKRNENHPPSVYSRLKRIISGCLYSRSQPTKTMVDQYQIVIEEFEVQLKLFRQLVETDIQQLESQLQVHGAPWTPGRLPVLKK